MARKRSALKGKRQIKREADLEPEDQAEGASTPLTHSEAEEELVDQSDVVPAAPSPVADLADAGSHVEGTEDAPPTLATSHEPAGDAYEMTESMTYTQADMQILPDSLMRTHAESAVEAAADASASGLTSGRPSRGATERLVIRDIDVENFKSYFGRHRIGPFHKTFTSVIGPNGSGKSNVIDSMLFVFGRSAKKIRLEKLSEVIHNSAAHPHVTYASVTVNFIKVRETPADEKNPEQRVEIPGSELCIKREVMRSGASQYFIDGTRRSQKEVMDTLIQQGVDLEHNRFLILQGEVEQIALMKPKAEKEGEEGLLEYLDDLIGTNEFVGRITDVTAHAESAQIARLEALDKERRLKQEREALDSAKNSTVVFVTKDNHLQKTLIVMCQLRMRNIEDKLVEPRRLLEEVDQRIETLEQDVKLRREAKAAAEETAAKAKKDVAERTKARDGVRSSRQGTEARLEKLRSGANEQERARQKVQDQLRKCEEDLGKASTQQGDAEREALIHQQELEAATAAVTTLQSEHDSVAEKLLPTLRPLRQALEEKRKAFAPYDHAVALATEQLGAVEDRLRTQEANHAKRVAEQAQLTTNIDRHEARLHEIDQMLRQADQQDRREALLKAQDALADTTRRKYAIDRSIQEIKSQYREGEADDRAAEFLLSQRSLKGYYGTLRQLGRIDDALDVAAGVASNAWGFHVVEDRATATAALELLKQNNIGRATMMIITEVEKEMGARMSRPFQPPNPKAQRVFDLIKPTNAKFRAVFYQAVRDTLVVPTLAEARETAFGGGHGDGNNRYRVVTMKGELVEPNGTITGGGASPRGAKLKAARSPQDKQAIKEELQRLQQSLVQVAEEERGLQLRLHQLQESEANFSPEQLRRLRAESSRVSAQLDGDRQRLTQLAEDLAASDTQLADHKAALEADLVTCRKRVEEAESERATHHKSLEALEKEVEDAGGAAFKDITEQLKAEQARVEAEEAALRNCRRLVQKLRATQERRTADRERFQRDLRAIDEEAEEGAKEAVRACTEELGVLTEQLAALEAALTEAQTRCDEARAAVPVANSAALEAQKKLDDEQRYKQTEQAKIADALQELAKFEQKIDGCEAKIKENAELYGIETLQLEGVDSAGDAGGASEDGDDEPDDDDDEERSHSSGEDGDDEANDQQEGRRRHHAGRKRGRGSGNRRGGELSREELAAMRFTLTPEELESCDYDRSVHLAKALSEETKRLHGEIDFRAVALWRERDLAHREAKAIYEEKKEISDKAERQLVELKEKRRTAFMAVFDRIRRKLKEVYQLLTHGGDADMELVDVNDPFEGINFVVRPPKKSWKQISNLSGGEKTLSSLALIFSLHHIKPTPIYVMDEIDAALDFRNVSIVANYVLRQATGAQFIIISLRNNMFELAHQLVGVCKVNDITRTLVLMPRSFQRVVENALLAESAKRRRARGGEEEEAASSQTPVTQRPRLEDVSTTTPHSDPTGRVSKKSVRFSDELAPAESDPAPRGSQLSLSS